MPAGERELAVVKSSRFPPGICGMALVTRGRILCGRVIGIGGLVVIGLVAGNTFRGSIGIIPVDMTEIAIRKRMSAGERELRCGQTWPVSTRDWWYGIGHMWSGTVRPRDWDRWSGYNWPDGRKHIPGEVLV